MRVWIVAGVSLAVAGASWAQTVPAEERFTLERKGDAFVRLDRTSGAMSLCTVEPVNGLVCRLGADERAAYEAKVAILGDELKRAEDALAAQRDTPVAANDASAKPKGFFELFLARMIHAARRGDEPKATPDSGRN